MLWLSMPTKTQGSHNLTCWNSCPGSRGHSLMAPRGKAAIVPTAIQRNYLENSPHSATQQSRKSRSRPSPHPAVREEWIAAQKASFKHAAELTLKNTSCPLSPRSWANYLWFSTFLLISVGDQGQVYEPLSQCDQSESDCSSTFSGSLTTEE